MSEKDLKINFRYLTGNIACMSVDSVEGKPVHNDIDNEEAIILFNSLVGEKEGCQTIKTLLQKNNQLKEVIEEVREVVKELELHYQQHPTMIPSVKLNKLLQILDKVKEVK